MPSIRWPPSFRHMPSFPSYRPRRLRRTEALRSLMRETWLRPSQLVLPLFVRSGRGFGSRSTSMPGVDQTSVDELLRDAREAAELGVGGVLLFGIPDRKDATGSEAWNDEAPVQQAVRALKRELPQLVVITDVCMCEYTDHGHCGVLRDGDVHGVVDNDATLELLAREARLARARGRRHRCAERHDGRPRRGDSRGARRGRASDTRRSSATPRNSPAPFYGPFREAAESTPQFGDRRGYQMDVGERGRSAARSPARHRGRAPTW